VLYNNGYLFKVNTATASCEDASFDFPTPFSLTFGMGFSRNDDGGGETLFVAGNGATPSLATIDADASGPSGSQVIGPLSVGGAELTGTGAGELFALYSTNGAKACDNTALETSCPGSAIGQIDETTGQLKSQSVLAGHSLGAAWALAFWGGDFYSFTVPDPAAGTVVTRFRPTDGSFVIVARTPGLIAGVGVSTCAPGP
jgi:hypothetical protein